MEKLHKVVAVKKGPLRIIATLLLVVTLLTLSGLTATAATLVGAGTTHSCCDSGCDDPPAPVPCSSPDCPCFSCITMVIYPSLTLQRSGAAGLLPQTTPKLHQLSAYVRSIDYPPEKG